MEYKAHHKALTCVALNDSNWISQAQQAGKEPNIIADEAIPGHKLLSLALAASGLVLCK